MRKMQKFIFLLLAVAFIFSFSLLPSQGSDLDEMRDKQENIKQEIEERKEELEEAEEKRDTLFGQLKSLNQNIEKISSQLDTIRDEITYVEGDIEETEKELAEAEERLQERIDVFSGRLKEIYEQGDINFLEVLLDSESFRDFLVRYHLLEKIAEQDMKLVDEIEAERQKIANTKADLEVQKENLLALERETKHKMESLEQKKAEREQLLASLESEKQTIEQALKELERDSQQITQRIRAAQARNEGMGDRSVGQIAWPTPGYTLITSDYGKRVHPILGYERMHTGIDIGAPMGTDIYSTESGVVIFAGWQGAYGNTVVIDHGGGLSTLSGHMSSISVSEGQKVDYQQKIGGVGSTGWSTGAHLHFEVRSNGNPVNPWNYLR